MTEFADNIRRIAKGTRQKGALGLYSERGPVLGGTVSLVTETYNGVGATPTSSGVNSPTSQENNTNNQPTNADNPDTSYKGGSGGTGSAITKGVEDIENVINGDAGPQTPVDNTTTSDSSTYTGDSLRGLTGATDCSTDQCINFHLDGLFPTPDGWEDPDTPPADPTWEQGYYWTALGGADAATVTEAAAETISYGQANLVDFVAGSLEQVSDIQWNQNYTYIGGSTSYGIVKVLCSDPGYNDTCGLTEAPVTESMWPTDGCYDLALIDGTFQRNQHDSEAPDGAGGGIVDFCYGDGKAGRIYVTANGGVMLVETSGGAPTGIARVYSSNGTLQAAGDATPTFMDQYLPT